MSAQPKSASFDLSYWDRLRTAENRIRAGHKHYVIGDEPEELSPSKLRYCGCAGRKFTFTLLDEFGNSAGMLVSHNVWCQGDIPEVLWEDPDFMDNAVIESGL